MNMLLDAFVRGSLVIAIAALLTLVLAKRSAAVRHHIWASALFIQVAILALIPVLPQFALPIAPTIAARIAPIVETAASPATVDAPPATPSVPSTSVANTAVTPQPAAPVAEPTDWRAILFYVWAAGAAFVFLRYLIGTLLMARIASRAERVDDGAWLTLAQRVSRELAITRPVTLLWGDKLGVPVTWGIFYPMVLLPESAQEWSEERCRFVLVHEMAHVRRFDALTQLVAQIALAVFWFSPFVWLCEWRIRVEREHACDDVVLQNGTEPTLYADELLQMVRALVTRKTARPAFAALAMARRSEFEGRMLAILDPDRRRSAAGIGGALLFIGLSLLVAAPVAALDPFAVNVATIDLDKPAQSVASTPAPRNSAIDDCDFKSSSTSVHAHADDEHPDELRLDIKLARPGRCVAGKIVADVDFTEGEHAVSALGPNASVTLHEVLPGLKYSARIERAANGSVQTSFYVDGNATADGGKGAQWIARVLPEIMRESGETAPARVDMLLSAHGLRGTLESIHKIGSPSSRTRHLVALVKAKQWNDAELEQIRVAALKDLGASPSERAQFLNAMPKRQVSGNLDALEEALGSIDSSTDLHNALKARLYGADKKMLLMMARVALKMESGYDLSTYLTEAASFMLTKDDRELEDAWFKGANALESDYERRNALLAAIGQARGNERVQQHIAKSAGAMTSSLDKSAVLTALSAIR